MPFPSEELDTPDGRQLEEITTGAAQMSIRDPVLQTIAYDEILRMEMPQGAYLISYPGDIRRAGCCGRPEKTPLWKKNNTDERLRPVLDYQKERDHLAE